MLKIRLQRIGRKNQAHFRVILTDHKNAAKTGKFIKVLGSYNPHSSLFVVDAEEVKKRMAEGAKLSDTVHNFLVKQGVIEGKKKNVLSKKSPTQKRKLLKVAK